MKTGKRKVGDLRERIPEQSLNDKQKSEVTEKMREAGSRIAADLISAQISKSMGGHSGPKTWEEFNAHHSGQNIDLIKQYVDDEIDSVTAIYIAMRRASETKRRDAKKR